MRLNKVFLMGALAIGLVACNSKNSPDIQLQAEGNTFASMQIATKISTRALDDSQKDHVGSAAENTLEKLQMISSLTASTIWKLGTKDAIGTFWKITNGYKTSPVNASPGLQTIAFVFNPGAINVGAATQTATHIYNGPLADLAKDNAFVMTSAGQKRTVLDNITEDVNKNGKDEAQNVFKGIDVERVVVKGIVRKASNFTNKVMRGGTEVATVSELKFAAVNGATKTFLYRDNAGKRTMEETDDNQYTGFKSAIHGIAPALTPAAAATAGLVRLGNAGADVSTAKDVNAAKTTADAAKAFYFMENSGSLTGTNAKSLGFYRYAYAKVYVKYTPNELLSLDADKNLVIVKAPTEAGGTFYKGAGDKLLYTTKEAAKKSLISPNQAAYTYKNGKCGYRTLWNRQTQDASERKVVINADTRRNNVYMLDIKDFAGLGFPWDPSDPNDPNLPHPQTIDPDSPDPDPKPEPGKGPDDPNIEPTETFMRVEAVVLPWNSVQRDNITLR